MIDLLLFALWFLLPAALANAAPIFVAATPGLKSLNTPLDLGKKFRNKEIFGTHKTWRGLISGVIIATVVFWIQQSLYQNYFWVRDISGSVDYSTLPILFGALLGLGALGGDAIESFFKRQKNVASGSAWVPFDQVDYIIGAVLLSLFFVRLRSLEYIAIFAVWFGAHLFFSYLGYKAGLKDAPI